MMNPELDRQSGRTNRLFVAGIILGGVAGAVGFMGMTFTALGAAVGARRRIRQMETPPNELARRNWVQMKAALGAGARAWRVDVEPFTDGSRPGQRQKAEVQ